MANLARVAQINAEIAAQGNKGYSVAPSASSGSSSTPTSAPNNYVSTNPHDAPSYKPELDPTSTAYNPNLAKSAPTTPITPTTPATPTTQINTSQPNPQTANATPYTSPTAVPSTQATPEQVKAVADATAQVNNLASQYKTGLAKVQGTTPPNTQGEAASAINATLPNTQNESPSVIGDIIQTDSNFDSILTEYDKFMSPAEQHTSLVDEYSKLSKSLGIDQINAELINSKRIIEGTEDDIRAEVTATGGMATDSQVLALANARNKSLIKNYNYLLDSRDNAMTQLNTMMNLTVQDRQMAQAEFDRKMNFAWKVAEFKQTATNNAKQTYMTLGSQMGWDTLLGSVSPYERGVVGKILGVSDTALNNLAMQSQKNRLASEQEKTLETQIKQQQLTNAKLTGAKLKQDLTGTGGETPVGTPQQIAQSQGNIESINNLLTDKNIRTAVGPTGIARLIGRGYDTLTGGRQNFISSVEQIRSNLNLEALIGAKARGATFGALSDQELQVLASSATKIGTWAKKDKNGNTVAYSASEKDFKKELEKINNFAKLDYILKGGDPTAVGIQSEGGHYYTKNIDGTITELR